MLWVTEMDLGGHGGIQRTLLQKRVGEFDGREGQDAIPNWVMACVLHGEFHTKEQDKMAFFLAPWIPPERGGGGGLSLPSTPHRQPQGKRGGGGSSGATVDARKPASLGGSRGSGAAGTAAAAGAKAGGGAAVGAGGVPPNQISQRFTAPVQMLVSKVMAYVLSHEDLHQHLESTVVHPEGGGATDGSTGDNGNGNGDGGGAAGGVMMRPSRETPEDLVEVLCGERVLEPHLYIGAVQKYIWEATGSGPTLFLHYRSRRRPPGGP
ncbi:unnamed protein product [Ectocarpus sp. 6 AP-2014]